MRKIRILLFLLIVSACSSQPDKTVETNPLELEPQETGSDLVVVVDEDLQIPKFVRGESDLVSVSENCVSCHSNLEDTNGEDVSFDVLWESTMMAKAAVDPYWIATVSSEIALEPDLTEVIQDKCVTCHMPLAHFDATVYQEPTNMFGDGFLNPENPLHDLAMEGVSCNLCHQIEPDNFGEKDSFSGGFLLLEPDRTWGNRVSYGPFSIGNNKAGIMQQVSGFRPVQSAHITESALCGTCHNLYTPFLDSKGNIVGEFPEQMTYKEWENSQFEGEVSCQECHMPKTEPGVFISSILESKKEYLSKHTFTGANMFMLNLLKENAQELDLDIDEQEIDNSIKLIEDQMLNDVGSVIINTIEMVDGKLIVEVLVENRVGHKFPTGYPSRRVWIHFVVLDSQGDILFESGAGQENGYIVGNDNDGDPEIYEPHYEIIDDPNQVQIYETILGNTDNEVTTVLLRAASYLKDNRLLPLGFEPGEVAGDIAVNGLAKIDENFIGGSDFLQYQIDLGDSVGPYNVSVELLYQSIGYRWANNINDHETSETIEFLRLYETQENYPVLVSRDDFIIGD